MEIREIKEKNLWESFLLQCREKTFLQSWNWGEFQQIMREKIWRFGLFQNQELVAIALAVKVSAKRGTFLLVPHGPITKEGTNGAEKQEILKNIVKELKMLGKEEKTGFIRINPIWERNQENNGLFSSLGFRGSPIQMHPEASWKLDITPPEEELLKNMRKTTRYLIKQAAKNSDLKIEQSNNSDDVSVFSELHKLVSKRQHFVPFSLEYLKNEFSLFGKDNLVSLFSGKYKGELAAASFVLFWSGVGFYHHAVSLPKYAKLSIPYLLQWEAIKEAKKRGCVLYDFWGYVDPKESPKHPWAGPTLFKMGFGGEARKYVKTQDLPLSSSYWLTYFFETLRKMKRGL